MAHLLQRSEFYTAYTPYQPEISQGTLQYIFEYQSMISELTGMEATNASMYDGATATAEVMFMMVASAKNNRVVLSGTLTDAVIRVVETYARFHGIAVTVVAPKDGVSDQEAILKEMARRGRRNSSMPQPLRHRRGLHRICRQNPRTQRIPHHQRRSVGSRSAPHPGRMGRRRSRRRRPDARHAATVRRPLPRLHLLLEDHAPEDAGTRGRSDQDIDGKRGYVLTLQAREQHIRREKATSNICSNQSLMALYATIYLALMGKEGMKEVNRLSCDGAH